MHLRVERQGQGQTVGIERKGTRHRNEKNRRRDRPQTGSARTLRLTGGDSRAGASQDFARRKLSGKHIDNT